MTELTVKISDDSLIPSLRRILKSLSGVISVQTHKDRPSPRLYDEETGKELNTKTMNLVKRVEEDKESLEEFDSVDSLMKDLKS